MIHHLRGTSAALAEKVFIRGGKRHGNYGRAREVSTLLTAESTSRSRQRQRRMAPGMLSRNYNASRRPFTHRLFALCHVFVSCRPKLVSRNSRSCHSPGNHPRNEPGPTKSGALCDAPPTKAPELFRWGLFVGGRSEEHTSELQSHSDLVCRLLLEKKKEKRKRHVVIMEWLYCGVRGV